MQCHSCQHENRAEARYCSECGQQLLTKCPQCGNNCRPDSRFCDGCGASLKADSRSYTPRHLETETLKSRFALEGEVKQVSVLFFDIANSSELAQQVGPEAMHDLLNGVFELAGEEIHRLEGTINQFLGDGFMALFGAPVAHEDHVRRALLAALGLKKRLGKAKNLPAIKFRMGVNTGSVVVGKIGDNLRMDYTAVGNTTNIAARLESLAKPGHIYVGESVFSVASAHFDFDALGRQSLKGIEEKIKVYDLLSARRLEDSASPARGLGIASPLVGRDRELALLETRLDELRRGEGSVQLLTAEPGSGKSRLVAEIKIRHESGDLRWLEGRAVSFGRTLSYLPFIEIFKKLFGIWEDDSEDDALLKLEKGLAPLFEERTQEVLPYLATVLALPLSREQEERVKYLDGQGLRRQVFTCTRQLFERLANRQPIVLILEDWHWADQSSIGLAEHLLSLTQTAKLLLFHTTRPEPEDARLQILRSAEANPDLRFDEIPLVPLTEEQSSLLLDNLVGNVGLPKTLREQILVKTEGNPFYIEEVIRTFVTDGVLIPDPRGHGWQLGQDVDKMVIPETIQALLLARIDRLEDEVKQVLKLASVIGRYFLERILQAINEAETNLDGRLSALEHAELIRLGHRSPEVEYVFNHALIQEAAYSSMLADSRRAIHQRIAQAIESLFADRLDEFTSLLAHHYTRAEVWEKAQEYLFKAGDQAGRMAGDSEALEHFRQAESAYIQAFGDKLSPLQRASLARKIGAALHATGHYEEALEHFRRALLQLGWRYPTSPVRIRLATLKLFSAHLSRLVREWMRIPAKPRLDIDSAQEASTICHAMAWVDYFLDKERMLFDCLLEMEVGETSNYSVAESMGLGSLGFGFMTYDMRRIARWYHQRAAPVARKTNNSSAMAFARFSLGFLDFYDGRWDDSEANLRAGATTYRDSGDIRRWGGAILMLSFITSRRGRLEETMDLAADLARAGQDAADPQLTSWGLQVRAYAELETGPLDEAIANMHRGVALARKIHAWDNFLYPSSLLCKALVYQGRIAEATDILEEALGVMKATQLSRPFDQVELLTGSATVKLAIVEQSEGASRKHAVREARSACRKALKCARVQRYWLPQSLRLYGTVCWLSGKRKAARKHWKASLDLAEDFGFPLERARTLMESGDRTGDADALEKAAMLFEEFGAKVFLASALHRLARIRQSKLLSADSAIRHFERALSELEAVNAEHDAKQARRELERLRNSARQNGKATVTPINGEQ
jgi:class 3 adenylate cyclase/tetratricopeptide (TPR) repeat protein